MDDRFKPQMGQQVGVMGAPTTAVGLSGSALPRRPDDRSSAFQTMGASVVPLAGRGSLQVRPAPMVAAAQAQAPPPRQEAPPVAMGDEGEVHTISVRILGGDGREYVADVDVVSPVRGSKLLGVSERVSY